MISLPRYSKIKQSNCFLYYNPNSYHSQKIYLALLIYRLKFKFQEINILENEQFRPWFVRINPDASLPAIRHGTRIITNTIHILDYLETHLSKGINLLPVEAYPKINHYMVLIDSISMSTLRYWVLSNQELAIKTKIPSHIRSQELEILNGIESTLSHMAERHPDMRHQYVTLIDKYVGLKTRILDRSEIDVIIATLESVLDELEHEMQITASQSQTTRSTLLPSIIIDSPLANGGPKLEPSSGLEHTPKPDNGAIMAATNSKSHWLCNTKDISAADVWVIVLLSQLQQLGLATSYWGPGLRPHLAKYVDMFSTMKQVRSAIPQYSDYRTFLDKIGYTKRPALFWGLGCTVLASVSIGLILYTYHNGREQLLFNPLWFGRINSPNVKIHSAAGVV